MSSPDSGAGSELVEKIASGLGRRGWTLASAESCTGGWVGKLVTDLPGASAFYRGGVIAYDNAVKVSHLDVDPTDIDHHGAVSRRVAEQMARGAARRLGADVGLSVTGVAGPDGGTPDKPVGTVWMAVYTPRGDQARREVFSGDRTAVREASARHVLEMVAKALG